MTPNIRARRLAALVASGVLVLGAAACGGDDDDTTSDGSGDGGSGGMNVAITSPADGDAAAADGFEVEFSSSEELGAPDTGKHHIHLFYDGDDSEYEVINGDSFTVDKLDAGEHTLKAVLANADHSLTDASDEITVDVEGEGDGGGGSDTTDDGY